MRLESAEPVAAAREAGITVFDTAHAYGDSPGSGERLIARALGGSGASGREPRIVTKGGMTRVGAQWVPDGRAKALMADCEASLAALDGLPIDLYLIHAPDPRTPWRTSVRALARLVDEGLVRRVGVSNVNRAQLEEAVALAPVSAVQVGLSVFDDRALRGGVVERCEELGVAVMAHSPLGGPRRVGSLARREALVDVALARGVTPAEVALAWLLSLSPAVVPIPGARRVETVESCVRAAGLELRSTEREALGSIRRAVRSPRRSAASSSEVVLVLGIPGAGKTRVAAEYVGRGYLRLNRDERGGALQALALSLDEELSAGARRVVMDNTYLTRVARSYVLDAAVRRGVPVRCVWLDTPLAQAQVNMVWRLLERFGRLPMPEELREAARSEPGLLLPTSQMRAVRELEEPSVEEGFVAVERVAFERAPGSGRAGVFVAAAVLRQAGWERLLAGGDPGAPHLVFDWMPDGTADELRPVVERLSSVVSGPVEAAVCPHGGGPPSCWCRPPLPGLPLAFARRHRVDPARSTLIGARPAHGTLASALGSRYVAA
jgi:aryl-alcohol dehydrogenase-like predicted oxidoreductase